MFENQSLLIVHTFGNGAKPPTGDLLCGNIITDELGSELSDDFRAKAFLLEAE